MIVARVCGSSVADIAAIVNMYFVMIDDMSSQFL